LAARCKYWQVLLSQPPDELSGFQWSRAGLDGLETLTFPTDDDVFSYSVVLALLQYLYTDKLIAPTGFGLQAVKPQKNKGKQTNAQPEEEEEATKANRRAWYKQVGRAAKYFQITRLRRLCQRATRIRGVNVEVPSSSLASDLLWLVEPQLQAFGNHASDSDVDVPAAETGNEERLAEIGDLERQMVQNRCADVKFTIGGVHMWAHKLVIASSCEYFRLMFSSGTTPHTRSTQHAHMMDEELTL
jgi:hypothetical protein